MVNDYKDYVNQVAKYHGISRCMKDIYESLNMDYIDYSGIKEKEEKKKTESQE